VQILDWFLQLPRTAKRVLTALADVAFVYLAFLLALYIRVGEDTSVWLSSEAIILVAVLAPLTAAIWASLGLYRAVIRFMSLRVLQTIFWGALGSTIVLTGLSLIIDVRLPRSIPFIYFALILSFVAGSRLSIRSIVRVRSGVIPSHVVIYGAGYAGQQLCSTLQSGLEFVPVAFVDDSEHLVGTNLMGIKVHSPSALPELVTKFEVARVLFAIPSASSALRKAIFNRVQALKVEMFTVPDGPDLFAGSFGPDLLRPVEISDLLGRSSTPIDESLLMGSVYDRTILITGAAGSIGSNLAQYVINNGARKVLLLDHSEHGLYQLSKSLSLKGCEVLFILGSIYDDTLVRDLFQARDIDIVFHAAAYKHVPIIEANATAAAKNNIFSVKFLGELSIEMGVKYFALISTDKAVRPTSVMGATKRVSELIVQDLASASSSTKFLIVRFGNVLDSSGSVVPLFREQIREGGPLTVTHEDVTRYFMTLDEAVSLVVQAVSLSEGGEIFVLDMGSPIRITELAEKMIHLSGLSVRSDTNPCGDIEIKYTGLRPGEKLHEELALTDNLIGTAHPFILRADEPKLSHEALSGLTEAIFSHIEVRDLNALRRTMAHPAIGLVSNDCDLKREPEIQNTRVALFKPRNSISSHKPTP
jgi:FlaA1/EpsC-like NDP-sugar epimerase